MTALLDPLSEAHLRDIAAHFAALETGKAPRASVAGPMAMVVKNSTQYLNRGDLMAIATFLKSLPQRLPAARVAKVQAVPDAEQRALGERIYGDHRAGCHGAHGQGQQPGQGQGSLPALAVNRGVVLEPPANVLRGVPGDAFGPSTAAHPQPHGMPPFATLLSDADIAAVVTHIRRAWGHDASAVTALDVNRQRGGGFDRDKF